MFRWLLTDGLIKHGEDQNEETGGSDRQRVFGMESPLTAIVKDTGDIDEELRELQTNVLQRYGVHLSHRNQAMTINQYVT